MPNNYTKTEDFDIYEAGRKSFVASRDFNTMHKQARKFFHCSAAHLEIVRGWLVDDELHFENPHRSFARMVWVASYVRR